MMLTTPLSISVWVVVWLWDSHPLAAIAGVAIFHALIAGGAVLALNKQVQAHGRPFAATLAELERDADAMRRTP